MHGCKSITPTNDGALDVVQNYLYNLGFKGHIKIFGEGAEEVLNLYAAIESNVGGFYIRYNKFKTTNATR